VRPQRPSAKRGSALLEFSVAILTVLTTLFGAIETGRLILTYVAIAEAAREGVRYAVVHGANRTGSGVNGPSSQSSHTQVDTVVINAAAAAGFTITAPTNITVTYSNTTSAVVGSTVLVTVTYTFTPATPLVSALSVSLSSTSQGSICY